MIVHALMTKITLSSSQIGTFIHFKALYCKINICLIHWKVFLPEFLISVSKYTIFSVFASSTVEVFALLCFELLIDYFFNSEIHLYF